MPQHNCDIYSPFGLFILFIILTLGNNICFIYLYFSPLVIGLIVFYWVSIGSFPFVDDLGHVSVCHLLVNQRVVEGIRSVFCEDKVYDPAHKNVQD